MKRSRWSRLAYIPLITWTIVILFPVYWVVITAFKRPIDVYQGARFVPWLDFKPTLIAWQSLVNGEIDVIRPLTNSLIAATTSATLAVLIGGMAAYGLARFRYQVGRIGNAQLAFLIISPRMIPSAAILIAFFVIFTAIGFQDSIVALSVAHLAMNLPFAVWILRDFFRGIPRELEESALVDGTSWWGAFLRITLPLAVPGLAATLIILFIFSWNEYFFASLLALRDASTLPVAIANQVTAAGVRWWLMSALTIVAIVPTIVLGFLAQRWIVRGLTAGAVK